MLSWILDAVVAALLALSFSGGVSWQGHVLLRHAADPRRAAILVAVFAAGFCPGFRARSYVLRLARAAWAGLETHRGRRIALFSGFLFASLLGCLQALALRVPMYDVGIFHQVVWALVHGHGFASTISGAGNFMMDHLSPSLALLAPFFALSGSSPLIFQITHPALLFTGVFAWVWLAENIEGSSPRLAAAVTLVGLVLDSLWGNLHWGFHESAVFFAAFSWALVLVWVRPQWRGRAWVLFVVAALTKEILLLDVALAFLVWAWLQRKDRRAFAVQLALFAGVLGLVFVGFEKLHHPADKNYFDRYYAYLGHGLEGFARTLLTSPWVIVQTIGARELGRYFLTVFLPWLFLPLAAIKTARKESLWLVAILPSLASAALATHPPLRSGQFHYILEIWPVMAVLTIAMLAQFSGRAHSHDAGQVLVMSGFRVPGVQDRWMLAWMLFALLAWDHDPWGDLRDYARGAGEAAQVREAFAAIPSEQSVSADELTGTWLAGRLKVTRWPALDTWGGHCPRWLVLRGESEIARAKALCGTGWGDGRRVGEWHLIEGPAI